MRKKSARLVLLDVGMQREYLDERSDSGCANAREILHNLKLLMAFARWSRTPVISCVDRFQASTTTGPRPTLAPLWPRRATATPIQHTRVRPEPNCTHLLNSVHRNGTDKHRRTTNGNGHASPETSRRQRPHTLLPSRTFVESDNCLHVSLDLLSRYQQLIFSKNHTDPFTNPKLDRLLTELPVTRFAVFGVPLEPTVRILALGLMLRKRKVTVIRDACGHYEPDEADMTFRRLEVKGCEVVSTEEFLQTRVVQNKGIWRGRRRSRSVA